MILTIIGAVLVGGYIILLIATVAYTIYREGWKNERR